MSAQHTPGPWRMAAWPHEQECMGATLPGTVAIIGADSISPAVVWGGIVESDANARLIAAAPAMRDIVRSLADAAYNCGQSTKPEYFDTLRQLEQDARALLATIDGPEGETR